MTVVIDDPETVEAIERQAYAMGKTPVEVVRAAIKAQSSAAEPFRRRRATSEEISAAVKAVQEDYRRYHNPDDRRTADEIIGYNESGHFD